MTGGPWYKGDPMVCRKCGTEFTIEGFKIK